MFTLGSFVFDYLDGMVARALKVNSPLGKELDSLADVVSFGVVPGAMLYSLLKISVCGQDVLIPGAQLNWVCLMALPAFILSAFSALRLARFNLDTRQTNYFVGLSTPACTVFVLGLTLAAQHNRFGVAEIIENQWFLYGLVVLFSWLLNSEIPMFGMKIRKFDWKSNALNATFVGLSAVLFFFLRELALCAVILCYILVSILFKNRVTGS